MRCEFLMDTPLRLLALALAFRCKMFLFSKCHVRPVAPMLCHVVHAHQVDGIAGDKHVYRCALLLCCSQPYLPANTREGM